MSPRLSNDVSPSDLTRHPNASSSAMMRAPIPAIVSSSIPLSIGLTSPMEGVGEGGVNAPLSPLAGAGA
jgi:hypothetical protein